MYSPRPSNLIDRFEADGQFVRSVVRVTIEDNDSKANMFRVHILESKNEVNFLCDYRVRLYHFKNQYM